MKSKISCWRLVRFTPARAPLLVGEDCLQRTCVRNVAPGVDGCNRESMRSPGCRAPPGYTRALCACGGIGRRARLRALWTEWSVEVRVLSGALRVLDCVGLRRLPDVVHERLPHRPCATQVAPGGARAECRSHARRRSTPPSRV